MGRQAEWAARNRDKVNANARAYRLRNLERVRAHERAKRLHKLQLVDSLKSAGCLRCGEKDPIVLVFHHRDPADKEFELGADAASHTDEAVIVEAAKCDVLCSNCHLRLHHELREAKRG